jgi:hypothetical protein
MSVRATLLIGSPRGPQSTSHALGTYLLDKLQERGMSVNKIFVQQSLASERGIATLLRAIEEANIIIFASPLYADSHPSGVIAAMELIHEHLSGKPRNIRQLMVAVSNSGFPESSHNDLSLSISRCFAAGCGFEWAGGLALGGGESIGGRSLKKAGGRVRNVRKSLELTAAALAGGENLPESAVTLMAMPIVPRWLYLLIGNVGWRWKAKKQGCQEGLSRRPYGTQ